MDPMRALRRAWAAFIGAVVFGFGYLMLIPPLETRATDSIVALAAALAGATAAVLVESRIPRLTREAAVEASPESDSSRAKVLASH